MKHPAPLPLLLAAAGLSLLSLHAPAFAGDDVSVPTAHEADASVRETMTMVAQPALSPDGKTLAFAWDGDIWLMPAAGGEAKRITGHEADDALPVFSPDGSQLAFNSRRAGGVWQVFVMPVTGGVPRRITFNSEGSTVVAWFPDAKSLLTTAVRDQAPRNYKPAWRFFRVNLVEREREEMLFDDYGAGGSLSPDGKKLLFTREDHEPYRLGYRGSQAGQVWLYDLEKKTFRLILKSETGYRNPIWRPDGAGFHCLDASEGAYNLAEHDLATGKTRLLTHGRTENCYTPTLSGDGSRIVFRRGFDLLSLDPRKPGEPAKIPVFNLSDRARDTTVRRTLKTATQAVFSPDGLETFFVAGGDIRVMDTTLGEPRAITRTAAEESSLQLSPDGKRLLFLRDDGSGEDLFETVREDSTKFWWDNDRFRTRALTTDRAPKSDLKLSPDGKALAYVRDRGDLVVSDADGANPRVLVKSWNAPEYAWSPDGKWIAYAVEDNDFNRDVWLVPADGSAAPVNLSCHPDPDTAPSFSPDGNAVAWLQRRGEDKFAIAYVWLSRERDQLSARDRKIEEAREKMEKERKAKSAPAKIAKSAAEKPAKDKEEPDTAAKPDDKPDAKDDSGDEAKPVKVDLADIHRRVRTLVVPFSAKFDGFVWSADSKKIGYLGALDGKPGIVAADITAEAPKPEAPAAKIEILVAAELRGAQRLNKGKGFAGLTPEGVPAVFSGDKLAAQKFSARQEFDGVERRRVAFLLCWRLMRDNFYDAAMNNRDWDAVRAKYEEVAAHAVDTVTFDRVVNMMLGELNGSHLGYRSKPEARPADQEWKVETAHPGLRFDDAYAGPGLLVSEVIADGPADRVRSRIEPGEILLAVDGVEITPRMDLTRVFNGEPDRDLELRVRAASGRERIVTIRPESYAEIRKKVRAKFLRDTADEVSRRSGGRLGYVYIAQMNWDSFRVFEKSIYEQGHGKDGLVIDVRDNGGGFTTDHLLTILCQPRHAITVPRDGGPGYPQDRHVYVAWNKPIVVLCNQNSFSNAEVFAHAVKNLGRGKIVGVRTAGGVISTGSAPILDMGDLRTPGRGWYDINTGADYELNGAKPDFELWMRPGEFDPAKDPQLAKAVEVLLKDVAAEKPLPKPVNAHADGR